MRLRESVSFSHFSAFLVVLASAFRSRIDYNDCDKGQPSIVSTADPIIRCPANFTFVRFVFFLLKKRPLRPVDLYSCAFSVCVAQRTIVEKNPQSFRECRVAGYCWDNYMPGGESNERAVSRLSVTAPEQRESATVESKFQRTNDRDLVKACIF